MNISQLQPANDFQNLYRSIEEDLGKTYITGFDYDGWIQSLNLYQFYDWVNSMYRIRDRIDVTLIQVISLIETGQLNDPTYHQDVTNLYGVIKQYDSKWMVYIDAPLQIMKFYQLYESHYITQLVKPYNLSLILETIYVIKDKTPIVDDNICDILSFLNDEKHFTKHQVDTEIYAIA